MKKTLSVIAIFVSATVANAEVIHRIEQDSKIKASRLNCEVFQGLLPKASPDYAFVTLTLGQPHEGSVFDFQKFTSNRNPLRLIDVAGVASCEKIEALKATADANGLIEVNIRSISSVDNADLPGSFFSGKVEVNESMNLTFKNGLVLTSEKWKIVSLRDAVSLASSDN